MSHQVLARKWRPRDFESLVGQRHVVQALSHALAEGRLHHAYLLTGTRGVGKTTIARILAKALNCERGPTARPCLSCAACTGIDEGRFVDYIEMDAASNRGVDEITQILENAVYAPTAGRFKVYVIDEVHMLSTHAFNAMLKTLEEPPPHVTFVLATTDPQKVPVTVLSRCLQFGLKNMPAAAVADHLARVLEAESIAFERAALGLIGRAAAGSMRDALSLLDQAIAFGGGRVAESAVREMLGVVDQDALAGLLEALVRGDGPALMALADQLREDNAAFVRVLDELALWLHRLALLKAGLRRDEDATDGERLDALAAAVSAEQIQVWYQIAIHGARDLPLAPEEFAGFSMSLLRMLAFRPVESEAAPAGQGRRTLSPEGAAARASAVAGAAALRASRPASEPAAARGAPGPALADAAGRTDSAPTVRAAPAAPLSSASLATAPPAGVPAATPPVPASSVEPLPAAGSLAGFDGDWPALARRLALHGFARQFMDQSELLAVDGDIFHVRVPIRPLAEATTVAKVTDALAAALGRSVRLRVEVGAVNGVTAAAQAQQQRGEQLAQARSAIDADPFVRALVRDFGASIVADSVAPVPAASADPGADR